MASNAPSRISCSRPNGHRRVAPTVYSGSSAPHKTKSRGLKEVLGSWRVLQASHRFVLPRHTASSYRKSPPKIDKLIERFSGPISPSRRLFFVVRWPMPSVLFGTTFVARWAGANRIQISHLPSLLGLYIFPTVTPRHRVLEFSTIHHLIEHGP